MFSTFASAPPVAAAPKPQASADAILSLYGSPQPHQQQAQHQQAIGAMGGYGAPQMGAGWGAPQQQQMHSYPQGGGYHQPPPPMMGPGGGYHGQQPTGQQPHVAPGFNNYGPGPMAMAGGYPQQTMGGAGAAGFGAPQQGFGAPQQGFGFGGQQQPQHQQQAPINPFGSLPGSNPGALQSAPGGYPPVNPFQQQQQHQQQQQPYPFPNGFGTR